MRPILAALLSLLASSACPCLAQTRAPAQHREHREHREHGRYGNPADLDGYIAHLADPRRDAWQKPDEVVAALGLRPGQTACDIGSGPGYFTLRLARAVGAGGRVYAVDVEPKILDALRERLAESGLRNVTPVLALADDALLPPGACDVVLIVDTYHHFPDRPAYLRRLSRALRPGGRVVNVDYHKRETPVGPPLAHRLSRETFLEEARSAGLVVAEEPAFLPYQYFIVLRAQGTAPGRR
jgi:ubiquinone/menaquinone biosynthesis C-methylase UbiE